jgi:hypothetical protein
MCILLEEEGTHIPSGPFSYDALISTQVTEAIPTAAVVRYESDKHPPGAIIMSPFTSSEYFVGEMDEAATTAASGRNHNGVEASVAAASARPAGAPDTLPLAIALWITIGVVWVVAVSDRAVWMDKPTTEAPPGAVDGAKLIFLTTSSLPDPGVLDRANPVQVVLTVERVTAPAEQAWNMFPSRACSKNHSCEAVIKLSP